jgi:hypothetical protein
MSLSNHLENLLLKWAFTASSVTRPTGWHVSLHLGDPGETGANEVTTSEDADYARKSVTFPDPTVGSVANGVAASWTVNSGSPGFQVTHIGIWDASSAGNFLIGGELPIPEDMVGSGVLTLAIGKIIAALD